MTLLDPAGRTEDGLDALSTQPVAPEEQAAPKRRGVAGALRLGWRRLTSMRTALQLLFLLSLAAVPGGLLPQRGQEAPRVAQYLITHKTLGPLFDRLSLFDVFKAPWFAAIYVLLFVSLVGCLAPRIRLHAKALRKPPPKTPARLSKLPSGSTTWLAPGDPATALAKAKPVLKGWRVAERSDARGDSLSAERGYARETGNLLFHVSLVVLLIGVAIGSLYGYEGDRVLADGPVADSATSFTNTRIQYDEFRPGGLVTSGSLAPWTIQLDQFVATYRADGSPADYVAHTTFTPANGSPRPVDIKVNHPLMAGSGTKVYLLNHGYAPVFALTGPTGQVTTSDPIICSPIESTDLLSRCELSFSGLPYIDGHPADLAFDIDFAPTGKLNSDLTMVSTSPELKEPTFVVAPYTGRLGHPVNVESLDYSGLQALPNLTGAILPGSADPKVTALRGLPGGYSLSVVAIRQWASFQVKRDPAKKLVLLAAIGIVSGLVLSLRVRRRRFWIRAIPDLGSPGDAAQRTVVEVGGLARSDQDAFRAETLALVGALRTATGTTESEDTPREP